MTAEQLKSLGRIMDDPNATHDERYAAFRLGLGHPPTKDHVHILTGYIQRQQAQNRYGK